ncbi:hypothetical protein EON81_12820 [bacterium]|nr:MAG: hypothetical protein EON81_12820 [bacterium]
MLRDVIWGVAGIAVAGIAFAVGSSGGRATAFESAVVTKAANDRNAVDVAYQQSKELIASNRVRLDKLDTYESQALKLKEQIAKSQSDLTSVKEKLTGQRSELASLTRAVATVRSQPVELPAGHFTVGRDIRPGRYTVVGDSNFIVTGIDGGNKVNTILGGGQVGVDRYVCDLEEGDTIEANGADSFYPMD